MEKNSIQNSLMAFMIGMILITGCTANQDQENHKSPDHSDIQNNKNDLRDFWIHFRAATRYRTKELWDSAIYEYKKALTIDPEHQDALFYLGNMYFETGNYKEAENTWLSLKELNPSSTKAYFQLGNLYLDVNKNDFFDLDKAEKYILKASELNRVVTGPQLILARIHLIRDNTDKADKYLESVLGSNDKNIEAHFLRGYIAWRKNQFENALSHYRKAVELSDTVKPTVEGLSEGDTRTGKSFERPASQSIFYSFFNDLAEINNRDHRTDLETKYLNLNQFISKLSQ